MKRLFLQLTNTSQNPHPLFLFCQRLEMQKILSTVTKLPRGVCMCLHNYAELPQASGNIIKRISKHTQMEHVG